MFERNVLCEGEHVEKQALLREWLQERVHEYGSQSAVARKVGVKQSTISRFLRGENDELSEATLRKIADAEMGVDWLQVARMAGLVPADSDGSSAATDLLVRIEMLSPEDQRLIYRIIRGLEAFPEGKTIARDAEMDVAALMRQAEALLQKLDAVRETHPAFYQDYIQRLGQVIGEAE